MYYTTSLDTTFVILPIQEGCDVYVNCKYVVHNLYLYLFSFSYAENYITNKYRQENIKIMNWRGYTIFCCLILPGFSAEKQTGTGTLIERTEGTDTIFKDVEME